MPLIRKDAAAPTSPAANPALRSADAQERWSAVRALAKVPGSEADLAGALSKENDPRVREAIFTSLAHLRSVEAVEAILPHIRSADSAVRTGALDALSTMPDVVADYLPRLLADPDADVRLLVCDVVRKLPNPTATQTLCTLLDREAEANVCAAAIEALSEVGDPSALAALARCATRFSHEPFLVFAIKIASDRVGGGSQASASP